jgi:AcrR family transcriptional regulator
MDLVTRQREERKARILEAARRLIAECGYEAVTMRELAEQSLVSVPTLYNFFGSKTELLFAAVESYFTNLISGIPGPEVESIDPGEGLSRIISLAETLGRETPRHAAYARSLMVFLSSDSDTGGLHDLVTGGLTIQLEEALVEMQRKRQLVAWADPRAVGECVASQITMTTFDWARHQLSDDALPDAMLYGVGVTLLGLSRGKAATELEDLVRKHQSVASARKRHSESDEKEA